jgi:hypothetical protein
MYMLRICMDSLIILIQVYEVPSTIFGKHFYNAKTEITIIVNLLNDKITQTIYKYIHIYVVPYGRPISRNLPIRCQFRDRRHIGSLLGNPSFSASSAYMALIGNV